MKSMFFSTKKKGLKIIIQVISLIARIFSSITFSHILHEAKFTAHEPARLGQIWGQSLPLNALSLFYFDPFRSCEISFYRDQVKNLWCFTFYRTQQKETSPK